jgi:hypothetical protein
MRLLFVAQESFPGAQVGPRQALGRMLAQGEISALSIFSLLWEAKQRKSDAAALEALFDLAQASRSDIVLWQTVGRFPVGEDYLRKLKDSVSAHYLAYQDGDPWGGARKPLSPAMKAMARTADLVFLCGLGRFRDVFRRAGAKRVLYCSHSVDTERFGKNSLPSAESQVERPFDAVMIGNLVGSRIPFLYSLPGARRRFEAARKLGETLGSRFAVFGRGWPDLPFVKGPIPFDQQEAANQQAWVTAGWDHYDRTPYYFSDRLPIALLSGVPHVTNYQPGFEHIFPPDSGIFFAKNPDEMVDVVLRLLSRPPAERIALGERARCLAENRLLATDVFGEMVRTVIREAYAAKGVSSPLARAQTMRS